MSEKLHIFSFPKDLRLSGQRNIDRLFRSPDFRVSSGPLTLLVKNDNDPTRGHIPARFLITVPKKKLKKAISRNTIKRRIREAIRLNKQEFIFDLPQNIALDIAVIYSSGREEDFQTLQKSLIALLDDISQRLSKSN